MKEFTLDFIRCLNCGSKLNLDIIKSQNEIEEGFLECSKCQSVYPIIEKIPIIWNEPENYFSQRRKLGGKLAKNVSKTMKLFLKRSLIQNHKNIEDRSNLEERWAIIYKNSTKSKFYSLIKKELEKLPKSETTVEYGCSIGLMSSFLAENSQKSFGIDMSFNAIKLAKQNLSENLDYIVADSLSPLFGTKKFDLVLTFNILELVEPSMFLKKISTQIDKGFLIISDPYDFDRGRRSVKTQLDENSLRQNLKRLGFKILQDTKKPSYLPWSLNLSPRSKLTYKTDLIIAKK